MILDPVRHLLVMYRDLHDPKAVVGLHVNADEYAALRAAFTPSEVQTIAGISIGTSKYMPRGYYGVVHADGSFSIARVLTTDSEANAAEPTSDE